MASRGYSVVGFGVLGLSVGFWVGDGRSGLQVQGVAYLPASAPCFCWFVADKRGDLARGHLYHQLRQATRRGGGRFLRAVAG